MFGQILLVENSLTLRNLVIFHGQQKDIISKCLLKVNIKDISGCCCTVFIVGT